MAQVLTDADIDKATRPVLTDADIDAHLSQGGAHQAFLDAKAARPNASYKIEELNSAPPRHPEIDKFKADHPYIYGALHGLFTADPLAPTPLEAPIAAAVESATKVGGQSAGDFLSQVLQHPKTIAAMKEAAMDWVKELPGVKALISTGKSAQTVKGVIDDVRAAQALSEIPKVELGGPVNGTPLRPPVAQPRVPAPSGTVTPIRPPLTQPNPAIPEIPSAPPASGPVTPVRPPLQAAPPAAYMDTEASGLGIPQLTANRARAAGNIARALIKEGYTQADLDAVEQSPQASKSFWENAGKLHKDGYVPSADTQSAVKDLLPAGKPGPVLVPNEEIPAYLLKNPKALAAAKALRATSIGDLMTGTGK